MAQAEPASEEAKTYLAKTISLIEEKHINSDTADWPNIRAQAERQIGGARSAADTYQAIRSVLSALNEPHSFLLEPSAVARPTKAEKGAAATPEIALPEARMVNGKFGLIALPALNTIRDGNEAGQKYSQALISGLKAMDRRQPCGWIIDLRNNGGGNMWPMLQGLDPLLGKAPFGYFAQREGKPTPWIRTPSGIFPSQGSVAETSPAFELDRQTAPVAVLIGPRTASSGEMVALALIGRERVRTFGHPTAGYTTANVPYPLGDGAMLVITETTVQDRTGKDYSGAIVPDRETSWFGDTEDGAVEWLESQC